MTLSFFFFFCLFLFFFLQAEDGIRDVAVTGVQTCALPILFTSYEKLEGVKQFNYSSLVSSADIERIKQITRDVYGYEAGATPASSPVEDEKILVKLDWNINEIGRASCRERV